MLYDLNTRIEARLAELEAVTIWRTSLEEEWEEANEAVHHLEGAVAELLEMRGENPESTPDSD